jgi:hypothetical protein
LADGKFSQQFGTAYSDRSETQGLLNAASKAADQPEESFLMPGDPKECRKHARNCLQLAEASANAEITRTFVDLAHSWTRLALDLESAQALLVAVEDMENAGSVGTGRATTPRVNIVTPKKGRPLNWD